MPVVLRIGPYRFFFYSLQIEPRAEQVRCTDDELVVVLADGRTLSVPLAWFPRLVNGSPKARTKFELLGNGQGIHWPALDEDISIAGLLAGKPSFEYRPIPHKALQRTPKNARSR